MVDAIGEVAHSTTWGSSSTCTPNNPTLLPPATGVARGTRMSTTHDATTDLLVDHFDDRAQSCVHGCVVHEPERHELSGGNMPTC